MKTKIVMATVSAACVILIAAIVLPFLARPSNCGGNSYALSACKSFTLLSQMAELDGKTEFRLSELEEIYQLGVFKLAKSTWIGEADFLVRTNYAIPKEGRLPVIVCDRPFDNVPQASLWNLYHKNPAHAVGYSDGSTGLILPSEFAALDLKGFAHLASVATTGATQVTHP